jgi:hypothetical protein
VPYATGTGASAVVAGDFNGDATPDLAVTNFSGNNVSILIGTGSGTFAPAANYTAGTNANGLATGDFDRDGTLDLAVSNAGSANVSIFLGTGTGTFAAAVPYGAGTTPRPVVVADLDHDGRLDLAVGNVDSENVSVLLGNGDGTFNSATNYAVQNPGAMNAADLNRDGNIDLAIASVNTSVLSILNGDGNGAFAAVVTYPYGGLGPSAALVADFNGDGSVDVATPRFYANSLHLRMGRRNGTLGLPAIYTVDANVEAGAVTDLNHDGAPDVMLASSYTNNVSVLLNQCIAPSNLVATAVSTTTVNVTWDAVPGATGYQLFRDQATNGFTLATTTGTTSYSDSGRTANMTYLYKVTAINPDTSVGPPSNVDLATTIMFTDTPLVPGSTLIKAVHLAQLQTAAIAVRVAGGTFGDFLTPRSAGDPVRASDVTAVRTMLDAARVAIDFPPIAYTDPIIEAGVRIRAAHVTQLRSGVQ